VIGLGLASQSNAPRHSEVVKLEPVVIIGKRTPEQLPPVLVQGHRASADQQVASLKTQPLQ
jgi:hypothetical protein